MYIEFHFYFVASFLKSGADIVVTVSYQASLDGLIKHMSVSQDEAYKLIKKSVELAKQACQEIAHETGFQSVFIVIILP